MWLELFFLCKTCQLCGQKYEWKCTISRHIQLLVFAPIYSFYNSYSHESDSTHMFTVIDYVFIILYIFGYSRVSSPFRRRNVRSATGCNSQSSSGFPSNLPKPDNGSIRHHECGPSNGVRSILCRRTSDAGSQYRCRRVGKDSQPPSTPSPTQTHTHTHGQSQSSVKNACFHTF